MDKNEFSKKLSAHFDFLVSLNPELEILRGAYIAVEYKFYVATGCKNMDHYAFRAAQIATEVMLASHGEVRRELSTELAVQFTDNEWFAKETVDTFIAASIETRSLISRKWCGGLSQSEAMSHTKKAA